MKIILEDSNSEEIEVIIRGNLNDDKVKELLTLLKATGVSKKIIAFHENREVLINVKDIIYFEVADRKMLLHTKDKAYICKYNLSEILGLFKSQGIVQIGKSFLVNVHHVASLEAEFSGNYLVTTDTKKRLIASRFYMKNFRKAIMEV